MRRRILPALSLLLGLVLVAVGVMMIVTKARPAPPRSDVTRRIIAPDAFPSPSASPGVDAPTGLRVQVSDLGIDLPVVSGDGWNAPLFKAATYPTLKLPGQGGRSMIYAHARPGMFEPLFHAKLGSLVNIDEPDGRILHYEIKQYFPSWSSTDLKWLQPLDHEELILVTCTTYDPNDPRIVVVAEPV